MMFTRLTLVTGIALLAFDARAAGCRWNASALSFEGSAVEQAACLLRTVRRGGVVDATDADLPSSLKSIVGERVSIRRDDFRTYLQRQGINEFAVGGAMDRQLSATRAPHKAIARYFVIHDTSTLACKADFPPGSDLADKPWNLTSNWSHSKQAHLFITRDGTSVQPEGRSFATPWRATQFEMRLGSASRGLFLHIENVQIRRPEVGSNGELRDPRTGGCVNDRIAENPGFTAAQYRRLAESFVAASIRKGTWLIPAYHAVLDTNVHGGHDDPQNFDLTAWAAAVCEVRSAVGDAC